MGAIRRRLTLIMASAFTLVAIAATAASAGQPPFPPLPLP